MRLGRIKNAIEFPFIDGPGVAGVFIEEAVDISGGSSEGFESFTERIALALQLLPDIALDGCARRPDPALFVDRVSIPQAAERFAVGDFWGGMQFTLAAAQWGVSAGKAVAALIGGGGPKVSANIPGQTGGAASTRSTMSSTAGTSEAQPTKVIRIEVSDNALLNGRMVRDLIDAINEQVTGNNVVLQATSSQYVQRRS